MENRDDASAGGPAESSIRPQEQLLLDILPQLQGTQVLCNTAGRAPFGAAFARMRPDATVRVFFHDLYPYEQTKAELSPLPAQLELHCEADPPPPPCDLAALAFDMQGEAELTRELLQAAHERLVVGGELVTTTNNPRDQWLGQEMHKLFSKVARQTSAEGTLYRARKTEPLRKIRSFDCEFMFRDGEHLLHIKTRPGVFSHRQVDAGARRLLECMELAPGMRVLDLGCGSGAVAMAAAVRQPEVQVLGLDSNLRAVTCAQWGRQQNQLAQLEILANADGSAALTESFDCVLANPPYYSRHRIADLFVRTAHRALRPDGELLLVTKDLPWYERRLPELFGHVEGWSIKGYIVLRAREKL